MYFKCQLQDNSFYGLGSIKTYMGPLAKYGSSYIVMIPPADAGNVNLVRAKKGGGYRSLHDSDDEYKGQKCEKPQNRKAWEWLEKQFLDMITHHCAGANRSPDMNSPVPVEPDVSMESPEE